jgi:hypothetical protein
MLFSLVRASKFTLPVLLLLAVCSSAWGQANVNEGLETAFIYVDVKSGSDSHHGTKTQQPERGWQPRHHQSRDLSRVNRDWKGLSKHLPTNHVRSRNEWHSFRVRRGSVVRLGSVQQEF